MSAPSRILILGGTADARVLAERLAGHGGIATITSLAGRTKTPTDLPGAVRTGGFGGAAGLAAYLRSEKIAAVIDATHPFAARISANAKAACDETKMPRLYLARARWDTPENADVTKTPDFAAAARHLAKTARRALLTTGTQGIAAFADCNDVQFWVRLIEPPQEPLPLARHDVLIARPPFNVAGERALMTEHAIDTLVTKDSGGGATAAKLSAAADLGVKIVMIARPAPPAGDVAQGIDDALTWIEKTL